VTRKRYAQAVAAPRDAKFATAVKRGGALVRDLHFNLRDLGVEVCRW
jgi:hypothetical protein